MKTQHIYIVVAFTLLVTSQGALAQRHNIGLSAGLGRNFLYTQNFSSKGYKQDYIHAYGDLQYTASLRLEEYLSKKIKLSTKASYIKSKLYYTLYEIEIDKFQISRNWLGRQNKLDIYTGLSYDIMSIKYSKLIFILGISNGILLHNITDEGIQISSQGYSTGGYDVTTISNYSYQKQRWQTAIESGLGWRIDSRLDINLLYSFGINSSAPLKYTYSTGFSGNTRESSGIIKGRPNYISLESVFWFKR